MPKLIASVPKYRQHKATGQAVVTICGKDHYLGRHGSRPSKREYDRLIGEWLASGRPNRPNAIAAEILVAEVVAAYWRFAKGYYPPSTRANLKPILRRLRKLYGPQPAAAFGPLALKALRQQMVDDGHCRSYANMNADRIRRVFKWAVSEELVPPHVHHALQSVSGLRKGRTKAREATPIGPVDDAVVDATLPLLPAVVADMVRLQRLTGARPAEVCILRPCDLDTSGEVWTYRAESHKTQHHGRARVIAIGPKAQIVLRPYLLREATAYCFSPVDSERKRNAERREARVSPMTPSQAARRPKRRRSRAPSNRYETGSYRRAIHRAVEVFNRQREKDTAPLPKWSPNRLRHTAATEIRKEFGLEAAQVALGHAQADVSQIYAERDLGLALEVARKIG